MRPRDASLDALKTVASQLIFFHHVAAYGPIGENLAEVFTAPMDWLYEYARMAVQVFLVLAGYLAIQSIENKPGPLQAGRCLTAVRHRYLRLAGPFVLALLLAIASSAIARPWFTDDTVPGEPTVLQFLAHTLMLQDILGHPALSAGVWYVAIDLQLFALLVALVWLGARTGHNPEAATRILVGGCMLASLFYFNLDESWDRWAAYFFGAYALGVAAFWIGRSDSVLGGSTALALVVLAAMLLEFRGRPLLAAGAALWLVHAQGRPVLRKLPVALRCMLASTGSTSYAFFLVHFPILLLANAAFIGMGMQGAALAGFTLLASWLACMATAWMFERHLERPWQRALARRGL